MADTLPTPARVGVRVERGGLVAVATFDELTALLRAGRDVVLGPKDLEALIADRCMLADHLEAVDGNFCRSCGCTQNNACEGGCSWEESDLCSSCAEMEEGNLIVCPSCDGHGDAGEPEPWCTRCDGTGRTPAPEPASPDSPSNPERIS